MNPKDHLREKVNVLGCKIRSSSLSANAFEIATSWSSVTFRCESEQVKNSWISVICRAKERTLEERKKILEEWSKEGECLSCIAALASEQAEIEEQAEANAEVQAAQKDGDLEKSSTDNEEKAHDTIQDLLNLPVANVEEQTLLLKDIFKKEIIVLALLRHFG